jgi:hypothetical protein
MTSTRWLFIGGSLFENRLALPVKVCFAYLCEWWVRGWDFSSPDRDSKGDIQSSMSGLKSPTPPKKKQAGTHTNIAGRVLGMCFFVVFVGYGVSMRRCEEYVYIFRLAMRMNEEDRATVLLKSRRVVW